MEDLDGKRARDLDSHVGCINLTFHLLENPMPRIRYLK